MRYALVFFLLLTACSSKSEQAEKEVEFLERQSASSAELCDAKRKLADAYRSERNASYSSAKLRADIQCATSEQDAYASALEAPDNMEALPDNAGL